MSTVWQIFQDNVQYEGTPEKIPWLGTKTYFLIINSVFFICYPSYDNKSRAMNNVQILFVLGSSSHIECPHCEKTIHKASINRHIKTQHGNEQNVQCQYCHGYYKNMDSLKYHLRQKHGIYQNKC